MKNKMSYLFAVIIGLMATIPNVKAQKPEPVLSFVKVIKPKGFYEEQVIAWRKEIDKNPKNASAWLNYYRANRYAHFPSEDTAKHIENMYYGRQQKVVAEMEKQIPATFEYYYSKCSASGLDENSYKYLEKAYNLQPDNPLTYEDMGTFAEIHRDTAKRNFFMKKLYEAKDRDPGILNFNYNVMSGLDANAILLTFGDNDTYPVWHLQQGIGFRKDIIVLNASLLMISEYRKKVFQELGISALKEDKEDFSDQNDVLKFQKYLIKYLCQNSAKRPVYISLTEDSIYTGMVKNDLYITGLVLKYSDSRIDNIAILQKNFEQNYLLDYQKISLVPDATGGLVGKINGNYLLPMLKLYEHYVLSGEKAKAENIRKLAVKIGNESGQEKEVKEYFEKN